MFMCVLHYLNSIMRITRTWTPLTNDSSLFYDRLSCNASVFALRFWIYVDDLGLYFHYTYHANMLQGNRKIIELNFFLFATTNSSCHSHKMSIARRGGINLRRNYKAKLNIITKTCKNSFSFLQFGD
jgi:hypothetical protein